MSHKRANSVRAIYRQLGVMTEEELKNALMEEVEGLRRVTVVERLHQRFTAVRAVRERSQLMKEIGNEQDQADASRD
jgi:hypothetical protein